MTKHKRNEIIRKIQLKNSINAIGKEKEGIWFVISYFYWIEYDDRDVGNRNNLNVTKYTRRKTSKTQERKHKEKDNDDSDDANDNLNVTISTNHRRKKTSLSSRTPSKSLSSLSPSRESQPNLKPKPEEEHDTSKEKETKIDVKPLDQAQVEKTRPRRTRNRTIHRKALTGAIEMCGPAGLFSISDESTTCDKMNVPKKSAVARKKQCI